MKHISLVFLFIVAGVSIAAAQTMFKVRLSDNTQLNVSVDGRYFNNAGTSVTVGDLPPGLHTFSIYAVRQNRRGRSRLENIYSGQIVTHYGYITIFTYDPYSRDNRVEDQEINSYTQSAQRGNSNTGSYEQSTNPPQVNNNSNDYGNDNKYIDPSMPVASPVPPDAIGTLTDDKTIGLKTKVAAKKTDTEKWNILKDELKDEKMSTGQVGVFMDWFSFESTKVDFAKWAYPNTVDKENYANLESKLTYKNYEEDLDKFIKDNSK